ncbi:MAG TPA: flagellar biosynthesis protein FlhB [Chthonomonadaceae bacterium]|nr:flagellar biosynthesis protein FlhB [Chthonomonadaceae bacterium]
MADAEERTESATPKRRGDARKKGQVAKSMELSQMVVLMGLLLVLHGLGGSSGKIIKDYAENAFTHLSQTPLTPSVVMKQGGLIFLTLGRAVGPLLLTAMILGVVVNMAQTGPMWSPERLKPDFNRINPLNGAKNFFSPRALVELAKAFYKIGLVGYIAIVTLRGSYSQLTLMAQMEVGEGVALITDVIYRMAIRVVVTMLVLAALDFAWQRYQFEKSIRMTKEEVKQEFKQQELSPQLKGRIRARQRDIARKRMMSEVPDATVVITNPTHFAVALKYDQTQMSAPVVVAKGQDFLAQKIRELAQEHDVPIVENPPLARTLYKNVEVGREISGDLYEAVAEVLAFVYSINQKRRALSGFSTPLR